MNVPLYTGGADLATLRALEAKLERTARWDVSVSDGHMYVTVGGESFDCPIERVPLLEGD